MNIFVSFMGLQRKLTRTDRVRIPLSERIEIVADLFAFMTKKYPELLLKEEMVLVTVNNHVSPLDQRLRENDVVSFIPHIGGG